MEPARPPLIKLKLADPINACHVAILESSQHGSISLSGVNLGIQDTRKTEHRERMKVSLELLLLAQTHHIGSILSGSRLYSMYGFGIVPHLADRRSKLVGFIHVVVHLERERVIVCLR